MRLYTRDELKDSRIFFDKQPPRYMSVFILFFICFMIVFSIGAQLVKRPYVVKAQGTVRVSGTSYVSTKTQGVITTIHVQSGQFVEVGQVILELSSGSEGLQATAVEAQIVDLEETLLVMDKYEQAISQKQNTLSQEGKELEYYGKLAYYLDVISQETSESDKASRKLTELQTERTELQTEINQLATEVSKIKQQVNDAEVVSAELNQSLITIETEQQNLLAEIEQLEAEQMDEASENEAMMRSLEEKHEALDQLTENIEKNQQTLDNQSDQEQLFERQAELEGDLEAKKAELEGKEEEIKQLNEDADSTYSQAEQTRLQLISELGEKRNQIENQLIEFRANQGVVLEQDTVHQITATESGILQYIQPLSSGMSLQQNQVLGEVAADTESFYVDAYIDAQDRSRVEEGNPVNVAIIGVNNYRFGTINGIVDFIEPSTIQNETAEGIISLYRARVSLEEEMLTSKSGEEIELIRSMPVEARVVYQEESYLEWMLDVMSLTSK